jgi:hypothetical protein
VEHHHSFGATVRNKLGTFIQLQNIKLFRLDKKQSQSFHRLSKTTLSIIEGFGD